MCIQSQNQVSCLVQYFFNRKYVLCNHQSNATHKHESYTNFASQIKKFSLITFFILLERSLFQQKTKQEKHAIISTENHQENKVENSSFTTEKNAYEAAKHH